MVAQNSEWVHNFSVDALQIKVYTDRASMGAAAARWVGTALKEALAARGTANLVFAAAPSQDDFLAALCQEPGIDWGKITAFHLDEYIGLSDQHPASFRRYLREHVCQQLPLGQVHWLNGDGPDPQQECLRYGALLQDVILDLACIGIGENGHLAFNDPPADFYTPHSVNVVQLDEACRLQQVAEGHFPDLAAVPTQALSLSIPAILAAQRVSCVVPGPRKAEAVHYTLEKPVSPQCPASILRQHPHCTLFLDPPATALLTHKIT